MTNTHNASGLRQQTGQNYIQEHSKSSVQKSRGVEYEMPFSHMFLCSNVRLCLVKELNYAAASPDYFFLKNMPYLSDFFVKALGQHDPTSTNLISRHIRKPNTIMRQT
ncbi:hypothetical protein GDO81_000471 [Engystomops pustulosus]|uniref:Uncharacterized protein n=1 Tax=Engystomops pustulosus TaxID=76066 RepID=A0AAV7D5X6_ENGPU|nr:hypothetical protein GDO81_000471 [Engystomops pustulosus]